jgi:hypothetical protein
MQHGPFQDQRQRPTREVATINGQGFDVNQGFELSIDCVEVWWIEVDNGHSHTSE